MQAKLLKEALDSFLHDTLVWLRVIEQPGTEKETIRLHSYVQQELFPVTVEVPERALTEDDQNGIESPGVDETHQKPLFGVYFG